MIWIRLLIVLIIPLLAVYYGMLILQCFSEKFAFTRRKIKFGRCLIPFYYWIAPVDERKTKKFSDYADEDEDENED